MKMRPVVPLLLAGILSGVSACKDDPVCGNGVKEKGEDCDCGDAPEKVPDYCLAPNGHPRSTCSEHCTARIGIKPTVVNVVWGISDWVGTTGSFDTCSDVGADGVHVELVGPDGFRIEERNAPCSSYQYQYTETKNHLLVPGTYTVEATLLSHGTPLTGPVTGQALVQVNETNILPVLFDLESFLDRDSLRGVLMLRIDWAGTSCSDASPVVATQYVSVLTSEDASPLPGFPVVRPCDENSWRFGDMPVGDFLLDVRGLDDQDATAYCATTPIFIGIGSNLPIQVSVPQGDATTCTQDASEL